MVETSSSQQAPSFLHSPTVTSPETIWVRVSHSATSHFQVSPGSPISLVPFQLVTTVLAREHHLCGSSHHSFIPPATSGIQVSPGLVLASLLWEERELLLIWLSSKAPAAAMVLAQVSGTFPLTYVISLVSVFKSPLQSLASKLHISWDSVGCSLCSLADQLGVPVGCMSKWVQLLPTLPPSFSPCAGGQDSKFSKMEGIALKELPFAFA